MKTQEVVSAMFILILVYLLVFNAEGTNKVIAALAQGLTGTIATLQGRNVSGGGQTISTGR